MIIIGEKINGSIIEVSDEKTPDNASETVEDAIRNKEGERLLKYIRDDAFVIDPSFFRQCKVRYCALRSRRRQ